MRQPKPFRAIPPAILKKSALAVLLAGLAGYVDAYAYLQYQFYVSVMSGNTTQTALHLGEGPVGQALRHLLPIVSFMAGVFAATLWQHSDAKRPVRQIFAACAFLLALSLFLGRANWASDGVQIVILAVAMGAMNTGVTSVGEQSLHIGYITNNINNLAQHFALALKGSPLDKDKSTGRWDTHWHRAALLLSVWLGFISGAFGSAILEPNLKVWTLVPPLLALTLVAASGHGASQEI